MSSKSLHAPSKISINMKKKLLIKFFATLVAMSVSNVINIDISAASEIKDSKESDANFDQLLKSLNPVNTQPDSGAGSRASQLQLNTEADNDIINEDGGNWYEKLQWWKKSKPAYEAIKELVNRIKNLNKELVHTKTLTVEHLTKWLEPLNISVEQLKEKTQEKIDELAKDREALEEINYSELTDEEKNEINRLIENLKELETVKEQLDLISLARQRLDQSVNNIAPEQIKRAESYLDKALDSFERIEKVFDDQKAKILFERIENSQENVESISNYLQANLKPYVNQLSSRIKQITQNIAKSLDKLEKNDIILRTLSPQEIEKRRLEQEKIAAQQAKALKEAKQRELEQQSYWQRFKNWLSSIFGF